MMGRPVESEVSHTIPTREGGRRRACVLCAVAVSALLAALGNAVAARAAAREPVVVAAGDIAGPGRGDSATAKLLRGLAPDAVLTLGDHAGRHGSRREFKRYYRSTWGRERGRTRPTLGDRDYGTKGARGYFGYFGRAAGERSGGYYSFDLGGWRLIALNSNCARAGGCEPGSPQERWLRQELAAHASACTLAFWHHPRFTSAHAHQPTAAVAPLWRALSAA